MVQPVTEGAPLFSLESDKSATEVESPATGVLRVLKPVGRSLSGGDRHRPHRITAFAGVSARGSVRVCDEPRRSRYSVAKKPLIARNTAPPMNAGV